MDQQLNNKQTQNPRQEQANSPAEIRRRLAMISDIAARAATHPNDLEAIAALEIIAGMEYRDRAAEKPQRGAP